MSLPYISFSGIDKATSRRVMYGASVCNVVLHVHVKQDSAPGKGAFLSEIDKAQYRARVAILPRTLPVLKDTSGKLHYFQV